MPVYKNTMQQIKTKPNRTGYTAKKIVHVRHNQLLIFLLSLSLSIENLISSHLNTIKSHITRLILLICRVHRLHIALLGAESEVGFVPNALECDSWMKERQARASNDNHQTLKNHEQRLVGSEEGTVEASGQLGTSVDGSNKDGDCGSCETEKESFEELGVDNVEVSWVPVSSLLSDSEEEVGACCGEQAQGDELEDETSQHDVLSEVAAADSVG